MTEPYVSIVVVARNDSYAGDFVKRVRTFATQLSAYSERYPGLFELLIVNWNPLPDRPPISEVVDWSMRFPVRVITVPPELHARIAQGSRMPVLEYLGKNVGIRRSSAPHVLVTNPDIIFSRDLVAKFAERRLDPNAFYRTDRFDFPDDEGSDELTTDAYYDRAAERVFQSFPRGANRPIARSPTGKLVITKKRETETYDEGKLQLILRQASNLRDFHVNASGDFILTSKENLLAARGFWERLDTFTHLDSMAVVRLGALGLKQIILRNPYFILHIDHSRAEQATKPTVAWTQIADALLAIHEGRCADYATQGDWGLAGVDLAEIRFNA